MRFAPHPTPSGAGARVELGTLAARRLVGVSHGKKSLESWWKLAFGRSPPLHRPIIFGNVRADLCEARAF